MHPYLYIQETEKENLCSHEALVQQLLSPVTRACMLGAVKLILETVISTPLYKTEKYIFGAAQ